MIHYMIDIETLDVLDDSLILSVAAVRFTQDEILDSLILYPDFAEQKDRTISIDTVKWWLTHTEEFIQLMDKNRKSAKFIYHQLAYFLHEGDKPTVWAKSPSFDLNILKHFFHQHSPLWKYSQEADVRTAYLKLNQKSIPLTESTKPHDALEDALAQARNVMEFLKL